MRYDVIGDVLRCDWQMSMYAVTREAEGGEGPWGLGVQPPKPQPRNGRFLPPLSRTSLTKRDRSQRARTREGESHFREVRLRPFTTSNGSDEKQITNAATRCATRPKYNAGKNSSHRAQVGLESPSVSHTLLSSVTGLTKQLSCP